MTETNKIASSSKEVLLASNEKVSLNFSQIFPSYRKKEVEPKNECKNKGTK